MGTCTVVTRMDTSKSGWTPYVVYTTEILSCVNNRNIISNGKINYLSEHNSNIPPHLLEQFHVLTKCSNKFDCLIKEMLFIRKLKPSLNVQTDSIRAKVFT